MCQKISFDFCKNGRNAIFTFRQLQCTAQPPQNRSIQNSVRTSMVNMCNAIGVISTSADMYVLRLIEIRKKVGDKLPNIDLFENTPGNKVNVTDICKGKKVILFATPAPFSPGCSKTHLPGYVKEADNLKEHGIGEIVCIAVMDAFVLSAWGKEQGAEGKIRILSDPQATFTKAIELSTEIPVLGGTRSMRYSMLLDDGVIKALNVEADGTGLSCSLAEHMKQKIQN